jgi:hypothetical protein
LVNESGELIIGQKNSNNLIYLKKRINPISHFFKLFSDIVPRISNSLSDKENPQMLQTIPEQSIFIENLKIELLA